MIYADTINVASTIRLDQVDASTFVKDTIAWTELPGDYWRLAIGEGLSEADPMLVIPAVNRPTGQWVRMLLANQRWQQKRFWAVDPQNVSGVASDQALGFGTTLANAQLVPLLTWAEVKRRLYRRHTALGFSNCVQVALMSTSPAPLLFPTGDSDGVTEIDSPFISVYGIPTVLRTSTLTAGTAAPAGNAPQKLVDSTIPVSWTASGLVSDSNRSRYIRTGTAPNLKIARVVFDAGSKTAHTEMPVESLGAPAQQIDATQTSIASGTSYQIISFPQAPGAGSEGTTPVRIYQVDIVNNSTPTARSFLGPFPGGLYTIFCGALRVTAIGFGWRAYNTGRLGCSINEMGLFWVNGSVLGDYIGGTSTFGEVWNGVALSTSGQLGVIQAIITVRGGCYSTRDSDLANWAFFNSDSFSLTIDAPCDLNVDTMIGDNPVGGRDQLIRIRSAGVRLRTYYTTTPYDGWTINLYGGDPVLIAGVGPITLASLIAGPGYQNLVNGISLTTGAAV